MTKLRYMKAPLPFQGQKRYFVKLFYNVAKRLPDDTVFVDLFGGSGLLSRTAKDAKPNCKVVYNDFDNYTKRLENIPKTNELMQQLRKCVHGCPQQKNTHAG